MTVGPPVVIVLKVSYGTEPKGKKTKLAMPMWTDNWGSGSALNILMTTWYPASAVLTEPSSYFEDACDQSGRGVQAADCESRPVLFRRHCGKCRPRFPRWARSQKTALEDSGNPERLPV